MVLVDGTVVVTDLGLVKLDPRDTTVLTQTAAFLGTRMYCAPEQLIPGGARKADARTDIYQLGKTLYELLTGESPALMDLDRLPRGLAYVIERATREQPSKRYQSVGQLIDAVKDYGRSKNPKENPVESFESALAEAEASLAQKRYTPKNLLAMLQSILLMTDDAELVINSVDKIPDQLIPYMFSTAGEDFEKVLEAYSAAVESAVGGYGFAYAETVARKMRKVADSASSPSAKAYAIKATLIAAVKLNRYAAMDIFDGMLTKIDTTEDAMAVAEMLRENIEEYKSLAPRIPKARLNPILRAVQRDATATEP